MAANLGPWSEHRPVDVPGTSTIDGRPVIGARLRPVTGREELLVADSLVATSALTVADELLDRCVGALRMADGIDEPAGGHLPALTVGDREVLLLRLRQITFGDVVELVVSCPDPTCAAPMDLRLDVDELCRPTTGPLAEVDARLALRIPTGADLAAVAGRALDDPQGAARALALACMEPADQAGPAGPDGTVADRVDDELLDEVGELLSALDPHADIELALSCPECGHAFVAPVGAADLLRDELVVRRRDLDVEVHLLARHYHWSEREILDLPSDRRRRYVDVLSEVRPPAAQWES